MDLDEARRRLIAEGIAPELIARAFSPGKPTTSPPRLNTVRMAGEWVRVELPGLSLDIEACVMVGERVLVNIVTSNDPTIRLNGKKIL